MLTDGAKIWIDALRSGRFKKGMDQLRKGDSYCCLGVACELAVEHGIIESYDGKHTNLSYYPDVREWIGLEDYCGAFESRNCDESLTARNDKRRYDQEEGRPTYTFKDIANLIERQPKGLFKED